jgi:cellulose synthase/poly-beta-1,6-N-acetylglucosamine synthase-like glycosyltransferase
MIYNSALILSVVSIVIYIYYIVVFHKGLKKRKKFFIKKFEKVSVVIAARNEEKNISKLLTILTNQTYPEDKYEIIISNDDSTDNTVEQVNFFCSKFDNIILVDVKNRENVISPKKNALQQAIDNSTGDIILLTDADCIPKTTWIESMISSYESDIDMVVGYSETKLDNWHKSNLAQKYEYFDFVAMFIANSGAILSGRYFSCSGQNLSYRKSAFNDVGGFSKIKHIVSGDDVNLMQLFRKGNKKIVMNLNNKSFVKTYPIKNWKNLINQRIRWASNTKWQIMLNPELFYYLSSIIILMISFVFFIIVDLKIAILIYLVKSISEYLFISKNSNLFQIDKERIKFYPIWSIIQPFYILIVGILGQLEFFKWKK